MADRILKPDSGNDLVLQNDDASAKAEINEDGTIALSSGSTSALSLNSSGNTILASGRTLDVSAGNLVTSTGAKQDIVGNAGTFNGTLDVSLATFTTSTPQKQAIVDGATIEAQDLASGSGTSLPNNVQDAITRLGTVTSGTIQTGLFPTGSIIQVKHFIFTGTQDSTTSFAPIQFDGTSSSTGYGCDITLSSSSNKVLIFGTVTMGVQQGAYNTSITAEYSTDGGSSYSNLDVMHTTFWAFLEHDFGDAGMQYALFPFSFSELKATGSTTNHFRMQIKKNNSSASSRVNQSLTSSNTTDNTTIQLMEVVG